ncbi:MAG: hypothetical protein GVY13_10640 [Alphaproteobacteria bacterium]|jgi:antitoxin VapB|nr:hypothetical protein [Alphaproteobacteria bacterium]
MPINIKDEDVDRQARRLAALTGQTLTAAVRDAIAETLRRVEQEGAATAPAKSPEAVLAFAREIAAHFKPGERSSDHADLYGEDGLPG